jgi:thiol-disulfide isomerase/thioredoxin
MRRSILLAMIVVMVSGSWCLSEEISMLPPLTMSLLDGATITDLDLEGDLILLFAIPNSTSCETGVALLQTAAQSDPELPVFLVAPEDSSDLRDMIAGLELAWPVILDQTFLLASALGVGRVPTLFLVRDGLVIDRLDRGFTDEELMTALEAFAAPSDSEAQDVPMPGSTIYGGYLQLPEPLLMVFVGAECSVCHAVLPQLLEIAESFAVTLVITEELTEPELFDSDAAKLTLLLDPSWRMADLFDVMTVPTFFLWNTDGTPEWTHSGYVENLENIINTYVKRQE